MAFFNEFTSIETLHSVLLTLEYALLALLLSWGIALISVRVKNAFLFSLFEILWVLPGFGYALLVLTTLRFLQIESRYSMLSVLFAWVLAGVPFLALAFREAEADLDRREKEALETLGANAKQSWFHFEFIRTLPAQIAALLQQFWLYLTSFSLVMILSGGPPNETLEVAIYTSVRLDQVNLTHARVLALWQGLILIAVRLALRSKRVRETGARADAVSKANGFDVKSLVLMGVLFLGVALFASFQADLDWTGFLPSLGMALALGIVVGVSCLGFSLACYYSGYRLLAEVGAFFSPMLFTLFWWERFNFILSPFMNCVMVQGLLFSPWVARSLFPLLDRVRIFDIEAARTLGARPFQAWWLIEWPRLRSTTYWVIGLLFSLSLTEVASVLLFSKNDFEPLSVWVQNSFMRFRLEEALLGTAVITILSYFAISRKRGIA